MQKLLLIGMLCLSTAVFANAPRLRAVVAQLLPQVRQQLAAIAEAREVVLAAACASSLCLLSFAAPAAPAAPSDLDMFFPDTTIVRTRGISAVFASPAETVQKSSTGGGLGGGLGDGISLNRYISDGGKRRFASTRASLSISARTSLAGFFGHMSTYATYPLNVPNASVWINSTAGAGGLLINNGKNKISYLLLFVNVFASGGISTQSVLSNLLSYRTDRLNFTALGYEYLDTSFAPIEGGFNIEGLRARGMSLYRLGFNLPLLAHGKGRESIKINLKLNSSMQLGGLGSTALGNTQDGELNSWSEDADFNHSLYHSAAASLRVVLAEGRLRLIVTGTRRNTIMGDIEEEQEKIGEFSTTSTRLMLLGSVNLIPEHKIRLETSLGSSKQVMVAQHYDGEEHKSNRKRTWARLSVRKSF